MRPILSDDGQTLTVRIPFRTRQRVGRKTVLIPDGADWAPQRRVDNAMVKALARAFRWRKELDTGVYGSLDDLATAKGIAPSYVSRILRLTLLAPEIVQAILDGRQPADLQLDDLLRGFPLEWERQDGCLTLLAPDTGGDPRRQQSAELQLDDIGEGNAARRPDRRVRGSARRAEPTKKLE